MAPPQRSRVLRCCSCRLFQAHQVKKSVKWTCKACGEKQSFLRAYGEGSGADCRRHVQKLNLLQGQVSELPLRCLEETVSAGEEENVGHQQAGNVKQQEKSRPSESRWLKYLEKDSQELELEGRGVCFSKQPSPKLEEPSPRFSQDLPRKRKWSQSTVQPPCSLGVQDSGGSEVAWEPQKEPGHSKGTAVGSPLGVSHCPHPHVSQGPSPLASPHRALAHAETEFNRIQTLMLPPTSFVILGTGWPDMEGETRQQPLPPGELCRLQCQGAEGSWEGATESCPAGYSHIL
ncbi:MRN complex-interacting protein isoform X9 [Symphalangus syndactylus]|uniref:MRN complex-interacting protein isoform X9 n=1 Tax=Symphalangus syndactylus TaxID=9590 RepID=UPI00300739B1